MRIVILAHFDASNRDVACRYFGRENAPLFANLPSSGTKNNLGPIDEETAYKVSAALWSGRQSKL